jgi:hypothetical protein
MDIERRNVTSMRTVKIVRKKGLKVNQELEKIKNFCKLL